MSSRPRPGATGSGSPAAKDRVEFGTEGADFTYDAKGFPQRTKKGKQQVEGPYSGLATATVAPFVLQPSFFPGAQGPQDVRTVYEVEQQLTATAVANPTVGHYSDACTEYYGRMSTEATDLVNDIVSGRKNISEWKPFWSDWHPKGLDRMAGEFQQSIERSA